MTETAEIYVPDLAGLQWESEGTGYTAHPNKRFWDLYRSGKTRLKAVGIGLYHVGGQNPWLVTYLPGADPERVRTVIREIEATRLAAELKYKASFEEQDRVRWERDRLAAEQRERDRDATQRYYARVAAEKEKKATETLEAQTKAKALLDRYGEFCVGKKAMRMLADKTGLDGGEAKLIKRLVRETEIKSANRRKQAIDEWGLPTDVDWPDADVAVAVRQLTRADWDEATISNGLGWSRADSSTGHWLAAILDDEPELAIATARRLVGKYASQLERNRKTWGADAA